MDRLPDALLQAPGLSQLCPPSLMERGVLARGLTVLSANQETSAHQSPGPASLFPPPAGLSRVPPSLPSSRAEKRSSILEVVTSGAANLLPQDPAFITQPASQTQGCGRRGPCRRTPASWRGISPGLEMKRSGFKWMTLLLCDPR